MKKLVIYIHGQGGNADEARHYKNLFSNCDVVGFDYKSEYPWQAEEEFCRYFDNISKSYEKTIIVANSIGAYFSLVSLKDKPIETAFLISPVVDMEKLILNMMSWAGVSEKELCEKREIATDFGQTLSWKYLCYARESEIKWKVKTHILYGDLDNLTDFATISEFADRIGAALTVMENGQHWFHTQEQMQFLDRWIKQNI